MRRHDREVRDIDELRAIIDKCSVCRIAMNDNEGLYIVPVNFGYELDAGKLTLYFHSAREGRKVAAMLRTPNVAFEMDCDHELIEADSACMYSYRYSSITGTGNARILEDDGERRRAMTLLMRHQSGREFSFTTAMLSSVALFSIEVSAFTGKKH